MKNPEDYRIHGDAIVDDVDLETEEVYVNGVRLTDALVEQMAAESVRLAKVRGATLVPGGKSLSGGDKHSPVIQTRVSEATRDRLRAIAERRKMSVSKLSRQVLDEYVNTHQ